MPPGSPVLSWLALLGLSAAIGGGLLALHISAALLLGPMAAAIVIALWRPGGGVPRPAYIAAQAILGCMIARTMRASILAEVAGTWPLFLFAVSSVIVAAIGLGLLLTRWRVLPGTTALWGSFPGAAATMTIMAEAFGADVRLVAFMQYLRVLMVALVASAVTHAFTGATGAAPASPPLDPASVAVTLALAAVCGLAGLAARLPAGPLLVPMVVGAVLQNLGLIQIQLPEPLLALAYAIIGWSVGLRFTREIIAHVAHALPRVVASIATLIAGCALFATALVVVAGIDPLTAYLAMSPGGADTVAIIAASARNVDMPFVMSLQMSRFVVILLIGPPLARYIAKRVERRQAEQERFGGAAPRP